MIFISVKISIYKKQVKLLFHVTLVFERFNNDEAFCIQAPPTMLFTEIVGNSYGNEKLKFTLTLKKTI